MKLKFIPTQKALQSLGYNEEKIKNVFNWKKKTGKNDFPRFHLIIENNQANIHIDKKRRHGEYINKFLGLSTRSNIVYNGQQLEQEIDRINLKTKLDKLEQLDKIVKEKINEIKSI